MMFKVWLLDPSTKSDLGQLAEVPFMKVGGWSDTSGDEVIQTIELIYLLDQLKRRGQEAPRLQPLRPDLQPHPTGHGR